EAVQLIKIGFGDDLHVAIRLSDPFFRRFASLPHGFDLLVVPRSERKRCLTSDTITHFLNRADSQRVAVELNDVMISDQRRDGQQSLPRAATRAGGTAIFSKLEQRQVGDMVA